MATIKEQICELIERLDEKKAREALDYVRWLIQDVDTEPLTDEERAGLAEAQEELARGSGEDWKKVKRGLGL